MPKSRIERVVSIQTILVIDDDESLRDTIGLMLEKESFRPILVGDGAAGLEQAFSAKPHLILVDLRMPGLNGVDVCKRLRASGAKTPVIVLSAVGDEIDKVLLLEIGADDYVVKPFGTRELMARIRAVLRRASSDARKVIHFSDGTSRIADEAYIRESIVNPQAKLVAGYPPIMPTFQGLISEEGLLQLTAYIKSLSSAPTGTGGAQTGPGMSPGPPTPAPTMTTCNCRCPGAGLAAARDVELT